uniref:Lysosomal alpha-glucosidase protein n=1 Tax=Daphnia magna TaxID=35525 RepID=A0A0P5XVY9_9CRUS
MKLGFYESEKWESNQSVYGEISDCLLKSNVKQKDLPVTEKPVKSGILPVWILWTLFLPLGIFLIILWISVSQDWDYCQWWQGRLKVAVTQSKTTYFLNKVTDKASSSCPYDVEDELKFDCFPQGYAEEHLCLKRGCCWSFTDKQSVPFCYYPANYALYSFVNVTHLNNSGVNGVVGYLEQIGYSGYPEDIPLLKLIATFETRSRLRVKIMDAENKRYEINVLNSLQTDDTFLPVNDYDYKFSINSDTTGFSISRKENREVIFTTVGVGGFIFANQFLQISSFLPSGNIYGLGEHQDSFRHSTNWQRFSLFNHDIVPDKGRNLYGSHPFYLVMENGGMSHGVFLKNSDPMEVILQPTPAITFRALGGILDFYFFLGPTPSEVIQQYTEVIGRPAMPPYWGLGFHLCRYNYGSLNRTREIWERTRAAGIPFDVQWNDLDYMDTAKDFTYDRNKFSGLPDFVHEVHAVGMHYVPLIDPGISNAELVSEYPPYDQGIEMDVFVKNSAEPGAPPFVGKVWNTVSTVWPDFTHPNATEYWTNQLKAFHDEVSFDGAWIDMNEPSNFYSGTIDGCPATQWDNPPYTPTVVGNKLCFLTLCMSAGQFGGLHYDVHNLYGLTETMVTNFALKQITGKRPFIISRSTFPGQGHFGGHWSGDVVSDWPNLRRSITSILNYNMFGIPLVGADICGFNGNTTVALCQRWMELGAFYPFSRNHNTDDGIDQDPVALGPAVVEASRKALMIRYMLLPYLYTLFWHAHAHGDTVARPLFFEFPLDHQTYAIDTQFLWGGGLMIVPVLTESTEVVEAYLPRSLWYDFYNLELISFGGKWTVLPAPLDTIPILLRGGYILPTQAPDVTTALTRVKPFDLLVTLNETKQAIGDLYCDDGEMIDAYVLSRFNLIQFVASSSTIKSAVINWKNDETSSSVRDVTILGLSSPVSVVTVNGFPHPSFMFNRISRVLFIKDLQLPLKNPFVISYQ